jgi:SAM-dependent methyltransferase
MYLELLKRARGWVDLEQTSLLDAMNEAKNHAHGRLLDVGCGDRPYEEMFRERVTEYVGVEYEESHHGSVSATKSRADVVYHGDKLPFADGSFDTVLTTQTAEHVPDPTAFFRELTRVLNENGTLIMTVPFSYRVHAHPHDYHRFTRFALARYAELNGLRVDVLRERGGMWSVVGQKLASHVVLRVARLGGSVQRAGALTYEQPIRDRPRYWTLPVALPLLLGVTTAARVLDRVDPVEDDTLGYLLIATKVAAA